MATLGRSPGAAALTNADIPSNLTLLGDYVKIPSATTTERDALTPAVGMMLYNTTLGMLQQYNAIGWASINSPPTVTSLNYPGDDTALDTVGEFTDATCDYNNDPTITHDTNTKMAVGMSVSGTGIPSGATIASVTSNTEFELSASTTGGAVTNGTLTFNTQTLIITGTNFQAGATVTIDGTVPSTVTVDSLTQITVTGTPAKTAGTYTKGLVVSNTTGLSGGINVDYSALPAWTTASGNVRRTFITSAAISTIDLDATEATSYALTTGAFAPGLAMNTTTGDITGTVTGSTLTTYNFTVTATDAQAQSSPRLFNIIVSALPTGGTITIVSGYRIHTFLTGANFVTQNSLSNIEYLMVAGGGGGGTTSDGQSGGGGAGGVITNYGGTAITLDGTYAVVIGTGGAVGASGVATTFNSLSATGGGYGGAYSNTPAASGGSGGGGHQVGTANVGGAGTGSGATRQGYAGGTSACSPNSWGGGGGGGYGSTGFAPTQADCRAGGNGGSPLTSTISGATVTYAGGGGGSSHVQTSPTSGVGLGGNSSVTADKGGGGNGGNPTGPVAATAGVDGTGGGGGGGTTGRIAAAGGDGIVIIRYPI